MVQTLERDPPFVHHSDVAALDIRTLRWTIHLAESDFPARRGHSAALHVDGEQIVVFGGTSGNLGQTGMLNDLWVLRVADVSAPQWEQPSTVGVPPVRRRGHGAAVLKGTMVVTGGYLHFEEPKDLLDAMAVHT